MLTKKYNRLIIAINRQIARFNQQLSKTEINPLPLKYSRDTYLTLVDMDWKKDKWPNSESNGVYFAFGHDTQGKHALYIGKASMSSSVGLRLSNHFSEHSFQMGNKEESFKMDLVATIPLADQYAFFAPALEEFLIGEMAQMLDELDFSLINKTGRY